MALRDPTPEPKSDIDPQLEAQIQAAASHAAEEGGARTQGQQVRWFRPADFAGAPFDLEGIHEPFSREQSNEWGTQAVTDPDTPGVTGDEVTTTLQVGYLSAMERAYRARYATTWPRAVTHAAGRKLGHAKGRGPLQQGILGYLQGLVQETKGAPRA